MIVGFIDEMRAKGVAIESICRVLSEQGAVVPPLEKFRDGAVRRLEFQARVPDVPRLIKMESAIEGPRLD
ncbi:hypothetical protein GYA93_16945 [Gordonia desulfuricans]|uniref:Uncharacterized protein n=1 Tax=Gordonia desulfuricans TaxID=89051 RepID=A0A7K3LSJ7_9ACTN|nr:hypothetical protein [Gordonia desulfuricans]NDK91255.1 hypothetical protein [Gordonia desulfuricans]